MSDGFGAHVVNVDRKWACASATPPPFVEFFEPIELSSNDEQLRTLTSPRATRQERIARWMLQGIVLAVLCTFIFTLYMPLIGGTLLGILALGLLLVMLADKLNFQSGWHLVPGGMAIVNHWAKARKKLRLLTRHDTIAQVRWAQHGKTQGLTLELLGADGRRFSRLLSERALLAVLAAWQSPLPPPKMEQLCELAGIDVEMGA